MYRLLKRWNVNDEIGWEVLGTFRKIRKARQAMHKDVREVEIANCYQSPDYGGLDDGEESRRISKDRHVYIISHSECEHVEWEITRGTGFSNMIGDF